MSTITNQLSGFIFNGVTTALASTPWKSNVRAIYGFNGSGNGYTVFKPTSNFNSLTQLTQDGVYIMEAVTPGFNLPGATLAASNTATGLFTIHKLTVKPNQQTGYPTVVANVIGADQIKAFYSGPAEFVVTENLIDGQDTVVETDKAGIPYNDIDSGRIDIQFLKAGVPVVNYSFWIHD